MEASYRYRTITYLCGSTDCACAARRGDQNVKIMDPDDQTDRGGGLSEE